MTPEEAKELAIKKWQYIANNNGDDRGLVDALPELGGLLNDCSYCDIYLNVSPGCAGCPLKEIGQRCLDRSSAYQRWAFAYNTKDTERMKVHARDVLELIKSI